MDPAVARGAREARLHFFGSDDQIYPMPENWWARPKYYWLNAFQNICRATSQVSKW